jgi:hypothetical protein
MPCCGVLCFSCAVSVGATYPPHTPQCLERPGRGRLHVTHSLGGNSRPSGGYAAAGRDMGSIAPTAPQKGFSATKHVRQSHEINSTQCRPQQQAIRQARCSDRRGQGQHSSSTGGSTTQQSTVAFEIQQSGLHVTHDMAGSWRDKTAIRLVHHHQHTHPTFAARPLAPWFCPPPPPPAPLLTCKVCCCVGLCDLAGA